MGLKVVSISHHAAQRYRRHHPDARWTDLKLSVELALPIESALAFALAGRRPREVGEHEEHRLHVEGIGVFVICELPHQPGDGFVRTYLRLETAEQRRMARRWFLDPMRPLEQAFEMGFEAARREGAPPRADQARAQHRAELASLAKGLVQPSDTHPAAPLSAPVPDEPRQLEPSEEPLDAAPQVTPGELAWPLSSKAQLYNLARQFTGVSPAMVGWKPCTPELLETLRHMVHVPAVPFNAALMSPNFTVAALISVEGSEACVTAAVNVPRRLRPTTSNPLPAAKPAAGPAPTARPLLPKSAQVTQPAPTPVHAVPADSFSVARWSPRALREAMSLGVETVGVQWLNMLHEVPAEHIPRLIERNGWSVKEEARYAGLRSGESLLLLRCDSGQTKGMVDRCGHM